MVDFIPNNKAIYGVDAICRILPIAASIYYRTLDLFDNPEHRAKRDLHDLHHAEQIKRIWKESSGRNADHPDPCEAVLQVSDFTYIQTHSG